MKYDQVNHVCTPECKAETQVYNPETEGCD